MMTIRNSDQGGAHCDDTDDDGDSGGSDCDLATFTQTGQRAPPSQTPHPGPRLSLKGL